MNTEGIHYREIKPQRDLQSYILAYWTFEYRPDRDEELHPLSHTVLPDGCVSLIFQNRQPDNQNSVILFGPRIHNFETAIPAGTLFVGVRFVPGVTEVLFNIQGEDLRDRILDAQPLLKGLQCDRLAQNLKPGFNDFGIFDQLFQQRMNKTGKQPDGVVQKAVDTILTAGGNIKVSEIAKAVSLSERQLQRRFRMKVGLTVKEFARIRRIRAAAIRLLLHEEDSQEVIYTTGFFDQAHFNRDFSMVVGTNPTKFKKYISRIRHKDVSIR